MNEQLIVKNFGPIKDATVDFKRVTVFIGPTGGGKSTLAKLAAIFRDDSFYRKGNRGAQLLLISYGLQNFTSEDTDISWKSGEGGAHLTGKDTWRVKAPTTIGDNILSLKKKIEEAQNLLEEISNKSNNNHSTNNIIQIQNNASEAFEDAINRFLKNIASNKPQYFPAERIISSILNNIWPSLLQTSEELPSILSSFAQEYIRARKSINHFNLPVLKISYKHENEQDYINTSGETFLPISEAASGIQSITPIIITLEYLSQQKEHAQSFIIEEPELNLYPTAQQGLMNWLVEKCTKGENDLTITTHSPYILSSCNLLIEAYKVWQKRPELEAEIDKIVPKASWINPDEFAAYYVADGGVRPIVDERTDLIGGNELDSISGDIADSFRKLLRLQKQPANA